MTSMLDLLTVGPKFMRSACRAAAVNRYLLPAPDIGRRYVVDWQDRQTGGRTDRLVTIAHAPFSTKRGMRVDRQTDRQIVALFNAPVWAGRDNRERKCADTTGTVLVHWAGHFQCENIKIFSNKIYGAILSNSTRKLLRFEITKKQLAG